MKWIDVILALITAGVYTWILVLAFDNTTNREIGVGMLVGTVFTFFFFLFTLRAVLEFNKK